MKALIKTIGLVLTVFLLMIVAFIMQDRQREKERVELYDKGYKDACVDFYKGKLKMQLVEQEDGSTTWQKIDVNADHRKKRGGGK